MQREVSVVRALALFSGGLDSMLAARLIMEQGVEVLALHFITPFFGYKAKGREAEAAESFRERYGVNVKIIDISKEYIEMVKAPRYGYGKNFNPCLDCKIFMMTRAREIMEREGYDFIISGEVLGQRPMSQRRDAMRIVERDAGLDGKLLRPLCAKHMKPTIPEEQGLVDRERLMNISGRSRKQQMELAERFGIKDYPTPAGGCLLTDPIISPRIRSLLATDGEIETGDVLLLAVGRHFDLAGGKLYVGRNSEDNKKLVSLAREGDLLFKTKEVPGPVSLFRGSPAGDDLVLSASITARYSDGKALEEVAVGIRTPGSDEETEVCVKPAEPEKLEALRTVY